MSVKYKLLRALEYLVAMGLDSERAKSKLPIPKKFNHLGGIAHIIEQFDHPNIKILEIGSREVTGPSLLKQRLLHAKYVGLDVHSGPNVDIVGDAHDLSKIFDIGTFDLVYSASVFEHLMKPWIVAEEINKVLKVGGWVYTETTFSYRAHERPWNFFQFSDNGLIALFNRHLGFQIMETGFDTPMISRVSLTAAPYLRFKEIRDTFAHSYCSALKTSNIPINFSWRDVEIDHVLPDTEYPRN